LVSVRVLRRTLIAAAVLALGAPIGGAQTAGPVGTPAPAPPAIGLDEPGAWACEEVGVGVEWCRRRFAHLFDAPQSLSVLRVDLGQPGVHVRFAEAAHFADPTPALRLERTSDIAARTPAVAAVNGDFFDGFAHQGPLIIDGHVRSFAPTGHPQATASFGFDRRDEPRFWPKTTDGWTIPTDIAQAISGGPMLLQNGSPVSYAADDVFASARHPRTAVCTGANRTIDLVVADGRTPEAAGLSLPELATIMRALGCTAAMNLDGGGSSTMWIRGKPPMGVVNHPSDDRKFDVFGERAVGAAVLVVARDVIVSGIDEAAITRSTGAIEARWELPVYFSGVYKVFVRPVTPPASGGASRRVQIAIDKTTATVDLAGRAAGWVEAGSTTVTVREGLVPGPVWVPIVITSGSTGAMRVGAIRLVQQP
jgi:hypothetical protein